MEGKHKNRTILVTVASIVILVALLAGGMVLLAGNAHKDALDAARSVSLLYLDELAGRREQVVEDNLNNNINVIDIAIQMLTEEDLSDLSHMRDYQRRVKKFFSLERFAFVDEAGNIYTADEGIRRETDRYSVDLVNLSETAIFIRNEKEADKKVVIAVPIRDRGISIEGHQLVSCYMEIDMAVMLKGVSMEAQSSDTTFSNIYTADGIALSNTVLGGLAVEDNLLEALSHAEYEEGYTYDQVLSDFKEGKRGVTAFSYNGIRETLSYVPVKGTSWMLTYLVREQIISKQIESVSGSIMTRSLILSGLVALALAGMFAYIIRQNRKTARLALEKETADAENRARQQEMEEKLALQDELLEERQALQEALDAAEQASRAKTAFLSSMSHEIRTPMNAIIGLDNIALNDPDISPKTREYLEKIGVSAQHLLGIINDILDMSRIESGRMVIRNEEFSFSGMLEQVNSVISSQCRDKGLKYDCRTVGKIDDYYFGDETKLRQVMVNILGNAVKFTPEGGTVTFLIEEGQRFGGKAVLKMTFRDTGIGMSREYLPRIFDAFSQEDSSSTSKYGSTGLGMPITKSIVELMNGRIEVESEKGKGTTFTVTVTLGESRRQAGTLEGGIQPGELDVLVVDDDPIALEHAQIVLGQAGVRCELAPSGEAALEKVSLRHARREDYDLLLVDWKMPEMDGVETTRRIRAVVGSDTPIVILTSYNWDEIMEEARHAGVDTFVAKPLFAGTVLDQFQEAFSRKKAKAAVPRADLKGRRVLLAEDVEVNAEIMVMVLGMREMDADVAENGRIAVDKYLAHPAGYYDAILMDMRMPEMDGLEATRAIRASGRKDAETIPIIALTANAFDEDVQRSMQAGLNAHLSKPVEPDALFDTLEMMIKPERS
jgi:signal transduction histidine kinase/DNA-binding response OmpR family regulator